MPVLNFVQREYRIPLSQQNRDMQYDLSQNFESTISTVIK